MSDISNFSDHEAEQKFVSCILSDQDALIELQPNATFFELGECKDIVQVAQKLTEAGIDYSINLDTVKEQIDALVLARYTADYVPSFHAKYYYDRVKDAYQKRLLLKLGQNIASVANADDANAISRARAYLDEIEKKVSSSEITTLTAEYLLTTEFPEPTWIVKNLLPAGLSFLAGKPKAGKSWLALQLAHAVGTGGEFMGIKANRRKVLYIALEDNARRLASRAKIQQWDKNASVRFITPEQHGLIGALEHGGVDRILSQISTYNYGLVVIDTLTRAVDSDQFSPQEMKRTLSPLQSGALKNDVAVLLIDHMPKLSGGDEDVISDVYGSISKVGIADTIIGFYRDRGSDTGKMAGVGRDIEEFSFAIKFDKPKGTWQHVDDHVRARYTEQRHEVLEYVADALDVTVTHVAVELGINKGTASKVLKDLESDSLLLAYSQGRKIYYQTTQAGTETLKRWGDEISTGDEILNAVEDK